MKRICWLSLSAIFVMPVIAQQRPHYTQYILNNYILNPALTGIENYIDVKLSIRNQWMGIPGAPQTYYVTAHGPIGKKDLKKTNTSFDMKGQNPRGERYWEDYTASEPHHGIGMQVINYRTGYINRFIAVGTYAYHMPVGDRTNLSAGFGAGVSGTTIDRSKIQLANPIDPAIGNGTSSTKKLSPELNAGLWLYSSNYFLGLSAQQIIPQKLTLVDSSYDHSTLVPHLFLSAGYRFLISEDINALPSLMFRYIPSMAIYADFNVKVQYLDKFWLGGSYRMKEGYAIMAGFNLSNTFNIGYSYDINNANYILSTQQKGTHELVLGFIIGNTYGDWCPRNVW
jgi:type IX secretion system PorP/SprF family membrane protein